MNRRERLHACYFHQQTDRPAVYSRTAYPPDDATYDPLKAYLRDHTELKGGWGPALSPWHTSHRTEPVSAEFERHITTLHTPAGDLTASSLASRTGQPGLHETYFIKSREDAETYLSLPPRLVSADIAAFHAAVRAMGDAGIVETHLGGLNPAGTVAELCGSENFALLSITDRDIIEALLNFHMQEKLRIVRYLIDLGAGPYFATLGQEYIVPPLHGPVDFNDFNVRFDKPWIDLIHQAGGRIHIHSHGRIATVLDGFMQLGADVLHPFEAPPMGDITAREAKARVRGRITIEGNIQIADMYERTPAEIRAQTEALMADAFDDGRGLIVSATASPYLPGEGARCLAQYRAMVETVLAWKP